MLKKSGIMILMSCGSALLNLQVNAQSLDLTSMMKDRYEGDCSIRKNYDLYDDETGLDKKLIPFTGRQNSHEQSAYSSTQFYLKNVSYRGVPVIKIEYSYGNLAKQMNQTLYLNVSTSQAKNNFNKTILSTKKSTEREGLSIEKQGKLIRVQCYWSDPYFA